MLRLKLNKEQKEIISNIFRDITKIIFTMLIIGPVLSKNVKGIFPGIIAFILTLFIAIYFKRGK